MADWWRNELYSQFGEDGVLLGLFRARGYGKSRKLDNFKEGFYVDIGAHHPFMISNTWFFYQLGWTGITVEPTPGAKEEFERHRPNDTHLQIAIADYDGEATFFSYGRAVDNTLDPSRKRASEDAQEITVPTMRLDTLLRTHGPADGKIDLLTVDVEGLDLAVLQSNDWTAFRPEVVVAELHANRIDEVLSSDLHKSMLGWRYELFAWTQPSVIYRRKEGPVR